MIPKTIHYCWFGKGEKSDLAKKCLSSWKKYCPDYKIIEWNEDNFDLDYNGYTRYCYNNKKWAFLSDFVRLKVIEEHGGIYFDTDVEAIRSFDDLLINNAFFGWENDSSVASGLGFGAEVSHPAVKEMLKKYEAFSPNDSGDFPLIVCPAINTEALMKFGLKLDGTFQNLDGTLILPSDYLNPYDDPTGRLNKTQNTYSIHWYSKSWMSVGTVLRSKITKPFHRIFGVNCFEWLKR